MRDVLRRRFQAKPSKCLMFSLRLICSSSAHIPSQFEILWFVLRRHFARRIQRNFTVWQPSVFIVWLAHTPFYDRDYFLHIIMILWIFGQLSVILPSFCCCVSCTFRREIHICLLNKVYLVMLAFFQNTTEVDTLSHRCRKQSDYFKIEIQMYLRGSILYCGEIFVGSAW